jgi:oxysterol-binding protein-related protein 9/10/11
LESLDVIPKLCPPEKMQLPLESHQVWMDVTAAIHAKDFSKATKLKQAIEARQRKAAAARKEHNEEWEPKYFVMEENGGRAVLSQEGIEMVESLGM